MSAPGPAERAAELSRRLGLAQTLPSDLVERALAHGSWAHERRLDAWRSNERFEFLGDSVLDLAVSRRLMERHPTAAEGELTRLYAELVSEAALARIARALDLGELLLLGRGEERTRGREKPSVLADALEAVFAAIYLGPGFEAVLFCVDRLFAAMFVEGAAAASPRDAKSALVVLVQSKGGSLQYRVAASEGPEHARRFAVECLVDGEVAGQGEGTSKKEAEQAAAREALLRLGG